LVVFEDHEADDCSGDAVYPWDPEDPRDVEAAERKLEFAISWFADPIYFGHYPASMRKQLGDRLPEFTVCLSYVTLITSLTVFPHNPSQSPEN
jgi:hypothetical protein